MANANMDGLPPEMQARIAQIIEGAKAQAVQQPAPPAPEPPAAAPVAPPVKQPNLMDHVIMLRQEVDAMRSELHAVAQVTDAVGQAVGQLYQTFLGPSATNDYGGSYETQKQGEDAE